MGFDQRVNVQGIRLFREVISAIVGRSCAFAAALGKGGQNGLDVIDGAINRQDICVRVLRYAKSIVETTLTAAVLGVGD